jgi:putative Holliday junction resolvase
MNILGIDYGRKKIGLALAITILAEAYGVIRYEKVEDAIKKIRKIVEKEQIEEVVVGISEGKMAGETKKFAKRLEKELGKPIYFQDETLSTQEAQRLSIEANVSRKKRREFEDAYTAAVILQEYLNKNY